MSGASTCGICVLAGGLSTRMGRDKARLRLGARTLLAEVRVVARQLDLPLRVIRRDLVPRCGPLGGVYTGLKTSANGAELFLACDMPFVSVAFLKRLLGAIRSRDDAVFTTVDGLAGFPFVVRCKALTRVARQIAREQFTMQKLARALKARLVRIDPSRAGPLFNVNTPAELATARRRLKALAG